MGQGVGRGKGAGCGTGMGQGVGRGWEKGRFIVARAVRGPDDDQSRRTWSLRSYLLGLGEALEAAAVADRRVVHKHWWGATCHAVRPVSPSLEGRGHERANSPETWRYFFSKAYPLSFLSNGAHTLRDALSLFVSKPLSSLATAFFNDPCAYRQARRRRGRQSQSPFGC